LNAASACQAILCGSDPTLVVEFLPYSGVEWTRGGRAAPWRRLHGATAA